MAKKQHYVKGEAWAIEALAYAHIREFKNNKGLSKINEAIQLAQKDTLSWNLSIFYSDKSIVLTRLGKTQEALKTIQKSFDHLTSSSDSTRQRLIYSLNFLKGRNYDRVGKLKLALDAYIEALNQAQKMNWSSNISSGYFNIGYIYKANEDFTKAIEYYQKSLKISRSLQDTTYIVYNLTFIAGCYLEENKTKKAYPYLKEAQEVTEFRSIKEPAELEITYYELANYYKLIKKYPQAISYLKKSRKHSKAIENVETLIANHTLTTECFMGMKKYAQAMQEAQEGVHWAKSVNATYHLIELYELMAQIAKQQGRFSDAYAFYIDYTKIKDEIFNEKKSQQLQELQIKYETQIKEQRIRELEQTKEIETLKIISLKKQRIILGLLLLVPITLLIGGGWYVNQRRLRLALESQKKERAKQLSELKAIRSQMNPHFIFNALNSIQDFILLSEKENAHYYLGRFAALIRGFLDVSSKEQISLNQEITLLKSYIELEGLRLGENFSYEIIFDKSLTENVIENIYIPPLLIQPYVENAFKHGLLHKKGIKTLRLEWSKVMHQHSHNLKLTITDNGVGRTKSAEIQDRKSKIHHSFATKATQERLELLKQQSMQNIEIKTIDLYDTTQQAIGTQVIIHIST